MKSVIKKLLLMLILFILSSLILVNVVNAACISCKGWTQTQVDSYCSTVNAICCTNKGDDGTCLSCSGDCSVGGGGSDPTDPVDPTPIFTANFNTEPTSLYLGVAVGTAMDVDNDDEYEYCYSRDGIQGGWLDPDISEEACDAVDDIDMRESIWLDCSSEVKSCENGINDALSATPDYLCCGDDYGEVPLSTKSREGSYYLQDEYEACCEAGDTCVDNTGVCRQDAYDYCLPNGGARATCDNFEWVITADDTCESACEKCDINQDGVVNDIDITAIDAQKSLPYNETYDVNLDGEVDDSDYIICNEFFEETCLYCGDDILSEQIPYEEECERVSGVMDFQCPDYYCSGDDDNNTIFNREGCSDLLCNCQYKADGCDKDNCGGCAVDEDCSDNQVCDTRSCSCQDYIVGGEVSMHIYETDCSYKVCVSGDESNGQTDVFKGTVKTGTTIKNLKMTFIESTDSITVDSLVEPTEIEFELHVTNDQDCFEFVANDDILYAFTVNDQEFDPDKVYFETEDTHPSDIPFYHATPYGNSCRVCIADEDIETTIDGRDNDCDGLTDEPAFTQPGVYVWEGGCEYFVCMYHEDASGLISSDKITDVRLVDWEADDEYTLSVDSKELEFDSVVKDDMDCIAFSSDNVITFDIESDNIYLGHDKRHPLTNPFDYANPVCAINCDEPGSCGTDNAFFGNVNCDSAQCLFDCGGYWVETESTFDFLDGFAINNPGDYCLACTEDIECSDYNNEYSCHYDPCSGGETRFGCLWDADNESCEEIFHECVPGTTLCDDGICRQECDVLATCIGYPDGECEVSEGCGCEDCELKQDSCTDGAVCGDDQLCGCEEGTALCMDNTCDDTCEDNGGFKGCIGEPNSECEFGEGCDCKDCKFNQDGCMDGLLCNGLCRPEGLINCFEGTTLCVDMTCDETCEDHGGKQGCKGEPDSKCEFGEGCACSDCYGKRDSCAEGLICDYVNEICDETTSGGGDQSCIDNDYDGYFEESTTCSFSNDCNDADALINPGMLELCDNIDNNCDGEIDEGCSVETMFTIESSDKIRVLDVFDFIVEVKNNQNYDTSMRLEVKSPNGIGTLSNNYYNLDLNSGDTKDIKFRMYVKDYTRETADIELSIIKDGETFSEDIPIEIEIPEFLIASDPSNQGEDCKDFYYVLNNNKLDKKIDMEFNIIDPDAILSKTLIVDYMSGLETNSIVIGEMLSNPYCIDYKDNYEIQAYIYQASTGIIMSKGPRYMGNVLGDESKSEVKVKVNIKG